MRSMLMMRRLWAVLVVALLSSSWGWGNGVYIPQKVALKMPEIPVQRALISYRDGVETLVVSSGVRTDSPEVGWILPVPAEPTELRTADADMLAVLELNLGPRIWHDQLREEGGWPEPQLLFFAFLPLVLALCLSRRPIRRAEAVGFAIAWLFLLALVVPQFRNAGESISTRGVNVSQEARIGQYNVSVLETADARALNNWLASQNLATLDERAVKTVDLYAREQWRFVVARLALDAKDLAAPEPLVVKFPTDRCVFPMRLTALADTRTRVDLFVASDRQASAKGFEVVAADSFAPVRREGLDYQLLKAGQTGCEIVNPDALEFLWPGCVVTHLQADMEPAAMGEDVAISFGELRPTRQQVYTSLYRDDLKSRVTWWGMVGMLPIATCVFYARRRPGRVGGGVLLAWVGLFGVAVLSVSQLPVIETASYRFMRYEWESWHEQVTAEFSPHALTDASSATGMVDPLKFNLLNVVTGQKLEERRTPGNVALRRLDEKTYFCAYDEDGAEYRTLLPQKRATTRGAVQMSAGD